MSGKNTKNTTLTATGSTDAIPLSTGQRASITVRGSSFTGTVKLEREIEPAGTWDVVTDEFGNEAAWIGVDVACTYIADESQSIRLTCTTFTGTSVYLRVGSEG